MLAITTFPVNRSHRISAKFFQSPQINAHDMAVIPGRGLRNGPDNPTGARGTDARGRRPDRDRSRSVANRSLVPGCNPEWHSWHVRRACRTGSRRSGDHRRQSVDDVETEPPWLDYPKPLGCRASETLCPMIRSVVKNDEDPVEETGRQARTITSGPVVRPRVAFLVSTTSRACSTIQGQS